MPEDKNISLEDYLEYEEVTSQKLVEEYGGNKKANLSLVLFKHTENGRIPIRETVVPDALFDMDIISGVVKFKAKSNIKNMKQFMEAEKLLQLYDSLQKDGTDVTCSVVVMHEDLSSNEFLGANDVLTWYLSGEGLRCECDTLCFVIAEVDLFNIADENYDYKEIQAEVIRRQEEADRLEDLGIQQELDKQAREDYMEALGMEQYDDSWATKTFVPDPHAEGEIEETEDGRNIFHRKSTTPT